MAEVVEWTTGSVDPDTSGEARLKSASSGSNDEFPLADTVVAISGIGDLLWVISRGQTLFGVANGVNI